MQTRVSDRWLFVQHSPEPEHKSVNVSDDLLLVAIDPAGERGEQQLEDHGLPQVFRM
jgi:hypothetical protein